MNYKIVFTREFAKEIKRLSSKYPSIKADFEIFLQSLSANPIQERHWETIVTRFVLVLQANRKEKVAGPE